MNLNDHPSVAPILERFTQRSGRSVTLEELITKWKRFVEDVEFGYSLTVYDYVNDLGTRRLLEELAQEAAAGIGEEVRRRIAESDSRFRSATRAIKTPVIGTGAEGDEWWCLRVPWRMGDELRRDLQS